MHPNYDSHILQKPFRGHKNNCSLSGEQSVAYLDRNIQYPCDFLARIIFTDYAIIIMGHNLWAVGLKIITYY